MSNSLHLIMIKQFVFFPEQLRGYIVIGNLQLVVK